MEKQCRANYCDGSAILMAIDSQASALERKPIPACHRHVSLWFRQARESFWWFVLGDDEQDSLTPDQVQRVLEVTS
jgi:hypothetical protein